VRHFAQRLRVNAPHHLRFAGMAGELFEQLEIRKAEPHDFHPPEHLVWPGFEHRLGFIDPQLVRSDQLHGSLLRW